MKLKAAAAYFAGALTVSAAAILGSGRPALLFFALGLFAAILATAVALGSRRRLRTAARLLNALAGSRRPAALRTKVPGAGLVQKSQPIAVHRFHSDVVSALRNMGMSRPAAEAATLKASKGANASDFQDLFRAALRVKAAA